MGKLFFSLRLKATITESHYCFRVSTKSKKPREESRLWKVIGNNLGFFRLLLFSFPNRRRPRVSVGEDAGPFAGCTGIQMRAEKALVDTQEWEQVPGDKDLEIRNTRGGAWSRGFQPTQELSPTLMFRLEEAALENQDWSWGWSNTVA